MAVINIIKLSELEGSRRIDADYYKPEHFAFIDRLKTIGAIPVKGIVLPAKRRFNPREDKFFDYIEIAEVDLSTGEFSTSRIIGKEAPDRAQWLVRKGDILVSTVRPIRNAVTIITEEKENLVCSSGFCVLQPKSISPLYLFIYFKVKPIAKLLDRYTTATEYPAVNWSDVLNIPIYLGDKAFRDRISKLVQNAFSLLRESKALYIEAENLLLKELDLKDFKFKYEISYTNNLSEAFQIHRVDAEYFQPAYEQLIRYIDKNFELKPLRDFLINFQRGIEVGSESYCEEGKPFIRVSNLSINGFIEKDQQFISEELYQNLRGVYEPKVGDLLLTKDATPGIAYVVKKPMEGIIASGILNLKIDGKKIEKEYLAFCINSIIGKLQIERDGGGSVITHWRPDQIKKLMIPVLPPKTQQKLALLVQQSHETREKAKELLDEAKRKVEEAIEKQR